MTRRRLDERIARRIAERERCVGQRVLIVGPGSSGTRLLKRIVDASPDLCGRHDGSHGTSDRVPLHECVVVILRDPEITDRSRVHHHGDRLPTRVQSMAGIAERYPDAPVVQYEDLVDCPLVVLGVLAGQLGVASWGFDEEITDENVKWM